MALDSNGSSSIPSRSFISFLILCIEICARVSNQSLTLLHSLASARRSRGVEKMSIQFCTLKNICTAIWANKWIKWTNFNWLCVFEVCFHGCCWCGFFSVCLLWMHKYFLFRSLLLVHVKLVNCETISEFANQSALIYAFVYAQTEKSTFFSSSRHTESVEQQTVKRNFTCHPHMLERTRRAHRRKTF